MPGTSDPYAAFRLNLEQQRKRAKDLLRAVRAGDAAARRRLADAVARTVPDAVTIKLADADRRLAASARSYARVVIWTEHDSHDQLSLIRCLAYYARTRPPRVLELISVSHFPGSRRFIGLGQLPPEAMRLLWNRREVIDAERLSVGAAAWAALTSADSRAPPPR